MKKHKITIAFLVTCCMLHTNTHANDGWGQKQSQDTVKGLLLGSLLGGVVGHQHDKQKEGIIIGSILGSVIGNKTGAGRDARHMQQQNEQNRIRLQQQRQAKYQAKLAAESVNKKQPPVDHVDTELIMARQRAEALERQVALELERVQAARARSQLLQQIHAREQAALRQLQQLKNL